MGSKLRDPEPPGQPTTNVSRRMRSSLVFGALAGPAFVVIFTAAGRRQVGYDPCRLPVSSLALGPDGWVQRANFILTGGLYCLVARSLAQTPTHVAGPRIVPALAFAAGVGLIGSGVFVTDPVNGYPAGSQPVPAPPSTTRGRLHNICAIPIFAGIPAAGLISAGSALRRRRYGWAAYSAGSAAGTTAAFALFGAGLAGRSQRRSSDRAGVEVRDRLELPPGTDQRQLTRRRPGRLQSESGSRRRPVDGARWSRLQSPSRE